MSILKIAKLGHPILIKQASIVENMPNIKVNKIIDDMIETMIDAQGIGLAAPQVHLSKQIIVIRSQNEEKPEEKTSEEIITLINPKIEIMSKDFVNEWEGCLSIPGMTGFGKKIIKN